LYNEFVRSRMLVTLHVLVCVACTRTETVTRFVTLHQTQSCVVPPGSFGKYLATGDFEPLAENLAAQPLAIDAAGLMIDGVPGNVQSMAVIATPFLGAALVPDVGDVDILLLPSASACALNGNGVGFDAAMVFAAVSSKTIIALGATIGGTGLTPSFRVDLGTGLVSKMSNPIGKSRTHAAVATFGDGRAFVIGGVSGNAVQQSVEMFDEVNEFAPNTFQLQTARSDHGAVALANGDVFVAGGATGGSALVAPTERLTFDGTQWRSNQSTTPALQAARTNPYVLRLADGTIMVGGGLDANGNPVTLVEFFSADGSTALQTANVPATGTNAFVALDGGGALFVDAAAPTGAHAWFVAPNVSLPITPDINAPLTDVKLFAHDRGGALLWTGSTWLVFDPWSGMFSALANAPTTGPDATSPITFGEPGMRAWVAQDKSGGGNVVVWRDSVRNVFATEGPYLVSDTSLMSPDTIPAPTFDAKGLTLDSTHAAFVSDARYLDVAVQVDGADVVIRAPGGEIDVGLDCRIQPLETLYVERHGSTVSFAQSGPTMSGPLIPCRSSRGEAIDPSARVAVGVRGSGVARNLVVKRLGTALP
jgi:hypothetical protein